MRVSLLLILCGIHLTGLGSTRQLPRDVKTFVTNAEACEHLAGEYDGQLPASEKRAIRRDVRKYCGAAHRQLPVLRAKYKNNEALLEVINRNANEAVTDYE